MTAIAFQEVKRLEDFIPRPKGLPKNKSWLDIRYGRGEAIIEATDEPGYVIGYCISFSREAAQLRVGVLWKVIFGIGLDLTLETVQRAEIVTV